MAHSAESLEVEKFVPYEMLSLLTKCCHPERSEGYAICRELQISISARYDNRCMVIA